MKHLNRSSGTRFARLAAWLWIAALVGGVVLEFLAAFLWKLPPLMAAVGSLTFRGVDIQVSEAEGEEAPIRPRAIASLSLSLHCVIFLLVPLYVIMMFAFSSCCDSAEPTHMALGNRVTDFALPEPEETASDAIKEGKLATPTRPHASKRSGPRRNHKSKRKESSGAESMQTNYDSFSDESLHSATLECCEEEKESVSIPKNEEPAGTEILTQVSVSY